VINYQKESDTETYMKACEIDDIESFLKDTTEDRIFYQSLELVVPPIELPVHISKMQDLDESERNEYFLFFKTGFVNLYPFLHACVCLAKDEPLDSFFIMLEKLQPFFTQSENKTTSMDGTLTAIIRSKSQRQMTTPT
jgi:hypothetical protein